MDQKTMKDFMEQINQRYEGIGARVSKRINEFLSIEQPIYNGPAYRRGLRAGDLITEVNGESVIGKTITETVAMLKGPAGDTVTVKVFRPGSALTRDFLTADFPPKSRKLFPKELQEMFKDAVGSRINVRIVDPGWNEAELTFKKIDIERQGIRLQSVRARMYPGKIGYIQLEQFGERGVEEVETELKKLERKGMEALVFDLRDNGGGLLDAAWKIVDKFVKGRKLIVYSKGRNPIRAPYTAYYSRDAGTHPGYPIVVLVNKGSASASEIVAGALKALGRATLLGKKTYGKGSVQQPFMLASRKRQAMLKLTVARYYFYDNTSIHEAGIQPDVVVSQPEITAGVIEEAERTHIVDATNNYVLKYYKKHKALFEKLAETDYGNPSAYPEFDEWYKGLKTTLGKDLARRYLRIAVRRRMQDAGGEELPPDLVDDFQLQRAIALALAKVGKKVGEFAQYAFFADKMPEDDNEKSSGK
jgi:carboxyl-terminal processing protease